MELLEIIGTRYPALLAILAAAGTVFASGLTTTILTQLTKLPFVPIAAKTYPRATSVMFAIITASLSTWLLNVAIVIDWATFLLYAAITIVVSWKIYDAAHAVVEEIRNPKPQV